MELKGFRPEATDNENVELYNAARTLWFGRDGVEAYVSLVFVGEKLGALVIRTYDDGEDYPYFSRYYGKRFPKCTLIEESADRMSWQDKDGDSVTVWKQPSPICEVDPRETVLVYLRRHVIQPDPAGSMPPWLNNIILGLGYAGIDY